MFKKKAHIKPFAAIRAGDRRKLATSVISDFDVPLPKLPPSETPTTTAPPPPPPTAAPTTKEESGDEAAASSKQEDQAHAAATAYLRNTLFPENTQSARFSTTAGPDLSTVNGTVYVGTHASRGVQRPLWVRTDDGLFPTCYTLHETPKLLPFVHTHTGVMEKIQKGADLMTPGLYGPPYSDSRAVKGRFVAIGDLKSPGVAMAVGIAEVDIAELKDVRGEKGKAVRVLHWVGDELWSLGGTGGKVPEKIEVEDAGRGGAGVGGVSEESGGEGSNSGGGGGGGGVKLEEKMEELAVEDKKDEEEELDPVAQMTTKEIDNTFRSALIYSLHEILNTPDRAANLQQSLPFPLASAYVLKELITPKLPSHHPSLVIGKTSWKKIQKMLKVMDKENILKIKERGGDVIVHAVDWEDSKIREFKPYPLPKASKAPAAAAAGGASSAGGSGGGVASAVAEDKPKVLELFKPTTRLHDIYNAAKVSTRTFHTAHDLKETLSKYFAAESLVDAKNGRLIKIDPLIAKALLDDSKPTDAALMTKGTIPRDNLHVRFKALHHPYYQLVSSTTGEPLPSTPKPKSGTPPKIVVAVETRMGRKTVTKVKGLEAFGINPVTFSEELRGMAASSTSLHDVVGAKPEDELKEVLAQGNQEANVEKLLIKGGVRREDITVDKSKLKGKK